MEKIELTCGLEEARVYETAMSMGHDIEKYGKRWHISRIDKSAGSLIQVELTYVSEIEKPVGGVKNCVFLWADMCMELVGVDNDGNEYTRNTRFGTVAESHGLPTSAAYLMATRPQNKEQRIAVAKFLREIADGIEAGT